MILTETEINKISGGSVDYFDRIVFARAVESALLENLRAERDALKTELAAMKSVEPVAFQYQSRDGTWQPFLSNKHLIDTEADGTWPIRALYTHQPSAVKVVREMVEALSCNRIMAADSDGNYTKEVTPRIITAAIAAGQQYLKENGK